MDTDTSGFYKNDNGVLLYGANFVVNKNYELYREQHDLYSLPVDGWYWFNTEDEAREYFNIKKEDVNNNIK